VPAQVHFPIMSYWLTSVDLAWTNNNSYIVAATAPKPP
jgi:hypothetical protein